MSSPRCPPLWFVYILMPGKEEWVLVLLGSQHKCVERPVRPEFPDYVFLMTMLRVIPLSALYICLINTPLYKKFKVVTGNKSFFYENKSTFLQTKYSALHIRTK